MGEEVETGCWRGWEDSTEPEGPSQAAWPRYRPRPRLAKIYFSTGGGGQQGEEEVSTGPQRGVPEVGTSCVYNMIISYVFFIKYI